MYAVNLPLDLPTRPMPDVDLRCGDWREVMKDVECFMLCIDAPYSAKTHDGHGTMARWGVPTPPCYDDSARRDINYTHWTAEDVQACVAFWAPRTHGWMVSLTDDVLFPVWRDAMADAGRTVFQDVPVIIRGMTVRLCGDGPSSWAIHCAVSRPATKAMAQWGTLPGGYHGPSERQDSVGGKPRWLMEALVRDYSRPGDLIADPCMGSGTTILAARSQGRRAVGAEIDPATFALAQRRLSKPYTPDMFTARTA